MSFYPLRFGPSLQMKQKNGKERIAKEKSEAVSQVSVAAPLLAVISCMIDYSNVLHSALPEKSIAQLHLL